MAMERMSMMLFAIILMVNMALLAVDTSGEISLMGSGLGGPNLQTEQFKSDLLVSTEQAQPEVAEEETSNTCDSGNFFMDMGCNIGNLTKSVVQGASDAITFLTSGMALLFSLGMFLLNYFPIAIGGYAILLTNWANVINNPAITILLLGIEVVLTIMYAFGFFNIIKSIAATVRGS